MPHGRLSFYPRGRADFQYLNGFQLCFFLARAGFVMKMEEGGEVGASSTLPMGTRHSDLKKSFKLALRSLLSACSYHVISSHFNFNFSISNFVCLFPCFEGNIHSFLCTPFFVSTGRNSAKHLKDLLEQSNNFCTAYSFR